MGKPFIKWAGGKRQLLRELVARMPKKYNSYFEPFVGGGALYWHLKPKNAILSDINAELINTYNTVKYNPQCLMADLQKHKDGNEYFLNIRAADRSDKFTNWQAIERASRFVFINKRCFNGLWKVNKKGQVNSSYGWRSSLLFERDSILECSKQLQNTQVACANYQWILSQVKCGDFVYLDPPYFLPKAAGSMYTSDTIELNFHHKMKEFCDVLTSKGVHWMMSNSAHEKILQVFDFYNINKVCVKYSVSRTTKGRRKVNEIIVTNYSTLDNVVAIPSFVRG